MIEWSLRLAAARHGIDSAAELRRRLAAAGSVMSESKVKALWSRSPQRVSLADLDAICAALGCEVDQLLRRALAPDLTSGGAPDDDLCRGCGAPGADAPVGGLAGHWCGRCWHDHTWEAALPALPDPPAPLVLTDAHGQSRRLMFTAARFPLGIEVWLGEYDRGPFAYPDQGYAFQVLGDPYADLDHLCDVISEHARTQLAHRSLLPHPDGSPGCWMNTRELRGRFVFEDSGDPHAVVVDGHRLSWTELGHTLESEEGACFRLMIELPYIDLIADPDDTAGQGTNEQSWGLAT